MPPWISLNVPEPLKLAPVWLMIVSIAEMANVPLSLPQLLLVIIPETVYVPLASGTGVITLTIALADPVQLCVPVAVTVKVPELA